MRLSSFLMLVFLSVALVACDSGGGDSGGLSKDESKTNLQTASSEFSVDLDELQSTGDFARTINGLFGTDSLSNVVNRSKQTTITPLGEELVNALGAVLQTFDGRLDFAASTGRYTWDAGQGEWTSAGSSGSILLEFPTERGIANNASFELSSYEDVSVTVDGRATYLPETVTASLTVDGIGEIFSVNLSNTDFYSGTTGPSGAETQVPRSFVLDVLTAPQTHRFDYNSRSRSEFRFEYDLERASNDRLILGLLVNASLKSDFDNVTSEEGIDMLSGTVDFGPDVTIEYAFDIDGFAGLEEQPSLQDLNDQFSITVNYKGQRAGTIQYAEVTQNDFTYSTIAFVYNNGDTEPVGEVIPILAIQSGASGGGFATAAKALMGTVTKVAKVFQP